jgi:Flp pilus assembly pilin Flp
MRQAITRFAADRTGSAAVEYSLIAAGVALAMLTAFLPFSEQLLQLYDTLIAGLRVLAAF